MNRLRMLLICAAGVLATPAFASDYPLASGACLVGSTGCSPLIPLKAPNCFFLTDVTFANGTTSPQAIVLRGASVTGTAEYFSVAAGSTTNVQQLETPIVFQPGGLFAEEAPGFTVVVPEWVTVSGYVGKCP
jgi:hypothetical protein